MVTKLEMTLNDFFGKKAPALPKGIKDFIVMVTPYLTVLGVIGTLLAVVPLVLLVLGLGVALAPFAAVGGAWGWGFMGIVGLVSLVLTLILEIMAIPGLFKKKKSAWNKLFWVSLISLITSLLSGNLVGMAVGALISWYLLFQIRSYYK